MNNIVTVREILDLTNHISVKINVNETYTSEFQKSMYIILNFYISCKKVQGLYYLGKEWSD